MAKVQSIVLFLAPLILSVKSMLTPVCNGSSLVGCAQVPDFGLGGSGAYPGMMQGNMQGNDMGISCHVQNPGFGPTMLPGSMSGLPGSIPGVGFPMNPCGPSLGTGMPGGMTGGVAGMMDGWAPSFGAGNGNSGAGVVCNGITFPDKGMGMGSGIWSNDCYNKISSIFMNGFIGGQKASEICCTPSAYGAKLLK